MAISGKPLSFYQFHCKIYEALHVEDPIIYGTVKKLKDELYKLALDAYDLNPDLQINWFNDLMHFLTLPYRLVQIPNEGVVDKKDREFQVVINPNVMQKNSSMKHLRKLVEVFQQNMEHLGPGDIPFFQQLFTSIYNLTYTPFFPDDPDTVYSVDEINILMLQRHLPWFIRSRIHRGNIVYKIMNTDLKGKGNESTKTVHEEMRD